MKRLNFLLLATLLFPVLSFSQNIITDRPDQTEASSTIPRGSFQIETGGVLSYFEEDEEVVRHFLGPSTLFRIGISGGFELRLLSQHEQVLVKTDSFDKDFGGISDLEIGFKAQLFKREGVNAEVALLSHLVIPSGTGDFNGESFASLNKLCISHDLSPVTSLGYNIGYNYFGKGIGNPTYTIALGISVSDKFGIFLEPYGEFEEFEEHIANFNAGCTYLIKHNIQADFSFGVGLNNDMNFLGAGVSWNIGGKQSELN